MDRPLRAPYFARWDGACFYKSSTSSSEPLKKVKHLSGGQKKAALGGAPHWSHGAGLLVLDEPTLGSTSCTGARCWIGSAPSSRRRQDGARRLAQSPTASTKSPRIWFLDDGRVVAHEDKEDLLAGGSGALQGRRAAQGGRREPGPREAAALRSSGLTGDFLTCAARWPARSRAATSGSTTRRSKTFCSRSSRGREMDPILRRARSTT